MTNGLSARWIPVPYAATMILAIAVLETCGACR